MPFTTFTDFVTLLGCQGLSDRVKLTNIGARNTVANRRTAYEALVRATEDALNVEIVDVP